MLGWIGRILGMGEKPPKTPKRQKAKRPAVRARYDAAQKTQGNAYHWAGADGRGPVTSNYSGIRRVLRNRARYEYENNCYCSGMVETLANDVVGTGPRLQVQSESPEYNAAVEQAFREWSRGVVTNDGETLVPGVDLAGKLRLGRQERSFLGESFIALVSDPDSPRPVKLDLHQFEPDCVETPHGRVLIPGTRVIDGVEYGANGKPAAYHVARTHPGDGAIYGAEYDRIEARHVIHWFRPKRSGQVRGVPEITAALPLYSDLRRYTLAVVGAAEAVAGIAAVLESDAPAPGDDEDEAVAGKPFDAMEIDRGSMINLPAGHKLNQLKAEQPTTTYPAFKREIISEIGRVLHMPYNVAAGDSSSYNYASGRLDHTEYGDMIRVDQADMKTKVLDRVYAAWLAEARLIPGYLPPAPPRVSHQWFFDGQVHVDPVKEATGQGLRLKNNTTTLADECALGGKDWEEVLVQRARERARMAELGIPDDAGVVPAPAPIDDEEGDV